MEKLFNTISMIFGVVGGLIVNFLGGWDGLAILLISFMVLDYITGILKAIYNKKLSSEIGIKGIIKKVLILIVVGIAVLLETNLGVPAVREIVMMFFICNEGISLLENIAQMGLKIPDKLKDVLLQLRDKSEESEEKYL
jgi:toxin secretion/phage lysis holin